MNLKNIQTNFASYLYDPKQDKILSEINSGQISPQDRFQIYHNNVFGSFDEVLESIYPAIKNLVGDKYFQRLSRQYHDNYRSTSGNLDNYGKFFAKLIKELRGQHKIAYLSDIAKLEWLYHTSYFVKDVKEFDISSFQKLSEDALSNIKFKLHPSFNLIKSKFPIYTIYQQSQEGKSELLDLGKLKNEFVLIERAFYQSNVHNIDKIEFLFLLMIKKGHNLYHIYEEISKKNGEFNIGALLNKFISNGVINSFL